LVCNFAKPANGLPSLLNMNESKDLFHEFGHALEKLMSKSTYFNTFSALDFSELPSQIMENWAFDKDVLKLYAKHYKTGRIIPDSLIRKIENSQLFNQGYLTADLLADAFLDMAYHSKKDTGKIDVLSFEKEYLQKLGLIKQMTFRRSTYFQHLTGNYDAGYYSYIWSAVLDQDAFDYFKQKGLFNKEAALRFRRCILEMDGREDPVEMYKNFLGREAKMEPLLKKRGLI
jgi:peptidyl-dipeptidase Dcp